MPGAKNRDAEIILDCGKIVEVHPKVPTMNEKGIAFTHVLLNICLEDVLELIHDDGVVYATSLVIRSKVTIIRLFASFLRHDQCFESMLLRPMTDIQSTVSAKTRNGNVLEI